MIALIQTDEVASLKAQLVAMQAEVDRLKAIAYIDELTGLFNRRGFNESLAKEWGRSTRTGEPLSLLMIDTDHFKEFNDLWGHPSGDSLLRLVAQTIAAAPIRSTDQTFRWAGDEFAVLMPNTSDDGARKVAARILDAVRQAGSSVSIGVVTAIADPGSSPETLIESADKALYQAKKQGRNQFMEACI
jgi:diguanylate cyclase (GGDEF)-like protein